MKTLDLVLKGKWYDMIASGEKTEEYREIKPYWEKRLLDYEAIKRDYEMLVFRRFLVGKGVDPLAYPRMGRRAGQNVFCYQTEKEV